MPSKSQSESSQSETRSRSSSGSSLPKSQVVEGRVSRLDGWAVGRSRGADFAVSRRCRHQLADLSAGSVDAEGCLVCPWHQSRYDVRTGAMVSGPRGFLAYHGPTPGYTQLVLGYGRWLRLRVGRVVRAAGRVRVE